MTWDLINFWKTWHEVHVYRTNKEINAEELLLYDKGEDKFLVEHEMEGASIRASAVEISL